MQKYSRFDRYSPTARAALTLSCALIAACASTPETAPPAMAGPAPAAALPPPIAPVPQQPQPVRLREATVGQYVVKKGDTLWDIAAYFLKDPWQWPELWYVNNQVANPHLIYPGDVLTLAYIDGQPRLTRAETINSEHLYPQVRERLIDEAIPTIPLDAIRQFLRGPRFVDSNALATAPYVVEFTDEHVIGPAGTGIYVKNLDREGAPLYAVVRIGEAYRDPDTNELLGYEAIPEAQAQVSDYGKDGGVATLDLLKSYREVRIGDRLMPEASDEFEANFFPHAPGNEINGTIISVFDGVGQIGQYQIVTLNRGSAQGLEPGHVLSIFQRGRAVSDPHGGGRVQLPPTYAGKLMVFKTYGRLSYALVMQADRPIHVLDRVDRPEPSH